MSKSILSQEGWIAQFDQEHIKSLFLDSDQDPRASIFQNPVNHNSMRLTSAGFFYFKNVLHLASHRFKLQKKLTPKTLLQLEKFIQYPYYILNSTNLVVFDETTAIMLQLHDSNLEIYLNNLEEHL